MNNSTKLLGKSTFFFAMWAGLSCFLAYFCMYMFRKPFTAATFGTTFLFGLDYKILLVISQVLGYALSKFIGIKVISELKNERRIGYFLGFIGFAWLALLGFALTPRSWGPFWLFLNGLPLGMIWGIVFSFCEGRRFTELLTVLLSVNFILSSGVAKSLGQWVLALGIDERAMPFWVGTGIIPLLLLSVWMLTRIPPPSEQDLLLRNERKPMSPQDRRNFIKEYKWILFLIVLIYLILTVIRDVRDNFAVEIWDALGFGGKPQIYSLTELPVTLIVLLSLGMLFTIRSNTLALKVNLFISLTGMLLIVSTIILFQLQLLSPVFWMVISGIGLFLPYILFNGIIFDRLIAIFRVSGNVGFIMYIADAFGYLGSILVLVFKNFTPSILPWLEFYSFISVYGGVVAAVLTVLLVIAVQSKPGFRERELFFSTQMD